MAGQADRHARRDRQQDAEDRRFLDSGLVQLD
jgi:hypothetical protein